MRDQMTTRYGRSPWIDRFPKSKVPAHPAHHGSLALDAVIIGGGLTGCATAYAFAAAGVDVALLEADRIGRGGSGTSTGWLGPEPAAGFVDLEARLGRRGAKHVWQSWRRASLDFATLLRRLSIRCGLAPAPFLTLAGTPALAATIARERKARLAAGFDCSLVTAKAIAGETTVIAQGGLRVREGATLDPYRATLGLASAAVSRGARLFERSPVQKVAFTRKHADVVTAGGTIRTNRVIVATGMPTPLYKSLARHFWFKRRYHALTAPVPSKIRRLLGSRGSVIADLQTPPHLVRWVDDERLLMAGADSAIVPERLRAKTSVQRTGQLMYELSTMYPEMSGLQPSYGWDGSYASTAEGIPYIGPHRNFPHHVFALGDSSRSLAGAYLASRIMLRQHLGEAQAPDDVFGFTR
jgi:glycine/D-amino acid oxidase-like deaminating enzyme